MIIIMVIIMIIIIIIIIRIIIIKVRITIIIKCRARYRTPTATNTELLVTLHNGWKFLSNIKKNSHSDAARALYMPLKQLVHHLTWWIGVEFLAWNSPPLDFSRITVTVILIKKTIITMIIIIVITVIVKE